MDSRTPSGLHQTPGGVQPEYVGECKVLIKSLENWLNDGYLQALLCYITHLIFRVMIIEIQMVYIGTLNFIQKNQSELV